MCRTMFAFQARRLRHFSARSQSMTNQQRLQIVRDQNSLINKNGVAPPPPTNNVENSSNQVMTS
jgi:hypothetical protein